MSSERRGSAFIIAGVVLSTRLPTRELSASSLHLGYPRVVFVNHLHFADELSHIIAEMTTTLPPSSPRLPSPPPPTEIQIGPKSPSLGTAGLQETSIEQSLIDANASRRIHPGTKSADMAAGPPLVPLSEVGIPNVGIQQLADNL